MGGIVFLVLLVVLRLNIGEAGRIEQALLTGQRLEVILATGEVFGKVLKTQEENSTTEKKSSGNGNKNANNAAPSKPPKTDAKKASEDNKLPDDLAWIKEDFIGPRLPDDVLNLLLGEGSGVELKLERISVKELSEKPVIVIIMKGLGLSASTTEQALELPNNITMGFSPYAGSLEEWVTKVKETGHEIVLNVPMETKDYRLNDPGPYALLTQSSKEDNETRLKMLLGLLKDFHAVYSEREEIFTHTLNSAKPMLEVLKRQRKYFIYGSGYADFSLIQTADSMAYPILVTDLFLDDDISQDGINEKLRLIEKTATDRHYVVVMARPYPITIRMLERWVPEAEKRGFNIAPVSLLLGKKFIE